MADKEKIPLMMMKRGWRVEEEGWSMERVEGGWVGGGETSSLPIPYVSNIALMLHVGACVCVHE